MISAQPLTKKNILTAVQGVAWRKLGKVLLPWSSSLNKIEKQYQSNDDRLHAVVDRWLCGKGKDWEPSWRELIWLLDQADETRVADNMRHFAEPVLGVLNCVTPSHFCPSVLAHIFSFKYSRHGYS